MNNNINFYRDTAMEFERRTDNEKTTASQSILTIMKDFIDSVNEMDETVLIPSRLMDIKVDTSDAMIMNGNGLNGEKSPTSLSMIPSTMRTTTTTTGDQQGQVSLHTYYSMLKAVKLELARGPRPGDKTENEQEIGEEDEDDDEAESVRLQAATARAFREHLRGLFTILTHLTDVSKQLTNIYQEETGDHQSCLKPKQSFIV